MIYNRDIITHLIRELNLSNPKTGIKFSNLFNEFNSASDKKELNFDSIKNLILHPNEYKALILNDLIVKNQIMIGNLIQNLRTENRSNDMKKLMFVYSILGGNLCNAYEETPQEFRIRYTVNFKTKKMDVNYFTGQMDFDLFGFLEEDELNKDIIKNKSKLHLNESQNIFDANKNFCESYMNKFYRIERIANTCFMLYKLNDDLDYLKEAWEYIKTAKEMTKDIPIERLLIRMDGSIDEKLFRDTKKTIETYDKINREIVTIRL